MPWYPLCQPTYCANELLQRRQYMVSILWETQSFHRSPPSLAILTKEKWPHIRWHWLQAWDPSKRQLVWRKCNRPCLHSLAPTWWICNAGMQCLYFIIVFVILFLIVSREFEEKESSQLRLDAKRKCRNGSKQCCKSKQCKQGQGVPDSFFLGYKPPHFLLCCDISFVVMVNVSALTAKTPGERFVVHSHSGAKWHLSPIFGHYLATTLSRQHLKSNSLAK